MLLWPTSILYTLSSAEVLPVEWSTVNWGLATSSGDSHTWRKNAKLSRRGFRAFQITQQRSNISRCFFHTKMCIPFLLLIALANCAHLLSTCLPSKNGVLYSEGRAYKRAPELVASPQSTVLHSTGNTSVKNSVFKNNFCHNSACWIVSPLLFFPLKLLLHIVYIANILCGLRL